MQIQRERRRRRGGRVLTGLLTLCLLAGAAYGGARLWQNMQDSPADDTLPVSLQEESPAELSREEIAPAPRSSQPEEPGEGDSTSPQIHTPASTEADLSDPGDANFSSAGPEVEVENTVTGDFAVKGQVPEGEKVTSGYFNDAIFFGDSISTGITAYNICNNTACVAAIGVSPNTALTTPYIPTKDGGKLTVLEAAKAHGERKKVYIMLGGNGLWQDKEGFISDYQLFIDAVKAQYPGATIYIQSMTPVTTWVTQTYPTITHEKVLEYNEAIAQLAFDNKLPFVNVFEALCGPNGTLPDDVSGDGLHLSAEYYFKWFDYLKSHTLEADAQ